MSRDTERDNLRKAIIQHKTVVSCPSCRYTISDFLSVPFATKSRRYHCGNEISFICPNCGRGWKAWTVIESGVEACVDVEEMDVHTTIEFKKQLRHRDIVQANGKILF